MIVSPGRGYVFVHVPKTGGTALSLALEARAMRDDILVGDTPKARRRRARLAMLTPRGRLWKHSTLADIDGVVTAEDLDRLLIVTLTRNPWDRMVSLWSWLQGQDFGHPAVALAKASAFTTFLNDPGTQRMIQGSPIRRYLTDAAGVERPALTMRIERLAEDIEPFARHLGFTPGVGRANASERGRDWRPYYSDADAALVGRLCAPDIARSGYDFDDYAALAGAKRP